MLSPDRHGTSSDPSPELIRAQLDRILRSSLFTRSERLSAFLKFVVQETLEGRGETLKEQVIAIELYGKEADFSTAADPIVRVDARRLRDRLREYYASAPLDPVLISIPKGSYTPAFGVNGSGAGRAPVPSHAAVSVPAADRSGAATARRPPRPAAFWTIVGGGLLMAAVAVWLVTAFRGAPPFDAPIRLLTVTSMPGAEEDPALSPDGNFVVFTSHSSDPRDPGDLWVKAVDGEALRQLTDTPTQREKWARWSPDGRHLAFTRLRDGPPEVFVISSLGGTEQRVAVPGAMPDWLPDGKSLVMAGRHPNLRFGLLHYVIDSGAQRTLTETPDGFVDQHPKVSPDGTMVAFHRADALDRVALFVVPLEGGQARQLTAWESGASGGHAWMPDGQEVLYARPHMSGRQIVRVPVDGNGSIAPVPAIPHGATAPSVSRSPDGQGFRVAFVSGITDVGMRMVDLGAMDGQISTGITRFCDATRFDTPGRFSPDGSEVAFSSDRSGTHQVWVARRDGSRLRSVTTLQSATVSVGSWSPDGRWIAFDATVDGNKDLYLVSPDGGPVKRLTSGRIDESDPEWSRDGEWIYYGSNESGRPEIWRMRANGTGRVQLTSEGAFGPRESPDGRSLLFSTSVIIGRSAGPPVTLKRMSTAGGPSSIVRDRMVPGGWDVIDAGIIFVAGPMVLGNSKQPDPPDTLMLLDFAGGDARPLGELPFRFARWGTTRVMTASRDGRSVLTSHVDQWERDIFVLDRFR
jgi:Tol biopolymer transport system component